MKTTTNEKKILEQLKKGSFKNKYLVYNRKSTDEPNNQKNSISFQRRENKTFALKEKLPIANLTLKGFCLDGVISERHSGFKEDDKVLFTSEGYVQYKIERPKFQKLMEYVSKGYIRGIICLSWDRISRNKGDDTIIRKLMRQGADFHFTYTNYENTSSGALHMDIDGMFAEHHSRVTSEKVSVATKNLRDKGICTYQAPLGYQNLGRMDSKPHDPKRAPIVTDLFKKYAEGNWSISDLTKYAREQGLSTVPRRRKRTDEELLAEDSNIHDIPKISRPITQNAINRMLLNPFYTGWSCNKKVDI